jgi:hypothetical protein
MGLMLTFERVVARASLGAYVCSKVGGKCLHSYGIPAKRQLEFQREIAAVMKASIEYGAKNLSRQ